MRTNVMIVHDGPAIRQMFINMLSPLGYRVLAASDGSSAVELLERERVEIAFIETRVSGAETMDLLDRLKSGSDDIRVIIIAENEDDKLVYQSLRSGVFACLVKPFSLDSVMDITESAHLAALRSAAVARRAA